MLWQRIIQHAYNPFVNSMIFMKRDRSWCFYMDNLTIKKIIILDCFLIPIVKELMDELHDTQIFSKLDLCSGYHLNKVHITNMHKTIFWTMSPSTFEIVMNHLFQHLLHFFVLIFFDDILIYNKSSVKHKRHLMMVIKISLVN